jgi:hypothetical protein
MKTKRLVKRNIEHRAQSARRSRINFSEQLNPMEAYHDNPSELS